MVLEALENIEVLKKRSWVTIIVAIIISSISIFVAYNLFPDSSGTLSIAFITIAMMPLIDRLFSEEEELEVRKPGLAPAFVIRHSCLMKFFGWFFLGLVISYSFWFVALPNAAPSACDNYREGISCIVPAKNVLFKEQLRQFSAITGNYSAKDNIKTAVAWQECKNPSTRSFEKCRDYIFSNNSFVMGLSVLLSFAYGAGALMLIGWNASVVGIFVGKEVVENSLVSGLALAIGYLPHGIFEISAYFLGAISGGIISAALSRKKYMTHEFEIIAKDVLAIMLIAYLLLFIGASIESWVILQQVYV